MVNILITSPRILMYGDVINDSNAFECWSVTPHRLNSLLSMNVSIHNQFICIPVPMNMTSYWPSSASTLSTTIWVNW